MKTQNSPLKTTSNSTQITVKAKHTLADYFDALYTARNYYDAMRLEANLPKKPLPPLQLILEAYTVCMAYIEAHKMPAINLVKALARLDADKIVAVWLMYKHPNLNLKLGNKQIIVTNTTPL
ncbi:hypothetical protein [Winogradskyella pulchriflava]|uniref:Uncharacterized protein n=1 Tax=Winogradskyella pulchriflava TaxID=1110688 RepID=A0ABV6QDG6_9FLAO